MNMRHFINMLLLEGMTPLDATRIFSTFGIDAASLDAAGLKAAYRKAAIAAHPDRGGDPERMKMLNAAYDVLKDGGATSEYEPSPKTSTSNAPPKADFHHIDYVKYFFRELAKDKPDVQMWTVWNFDGHFLRGVYTIPASPVDFPKVAEVMAIWDRFYDSKAIFISLDHDLYVISIDGVPMKATKMPEHDSFNNNFGNDQSYMRALPAELARIKSHQDKIGNA